MANIFERFATLYQSRGLDDPCGSLDFMREIEIGLQVRAACQRLQCQAVLVIAALHLFQKTSVHRRVAARQQVQAGEAERRREG